VTGRRLQLIAGVDQLEAYRLDLTAYCHRILGSVDAEDAVQETFIRALRSFDRLERPGSLRSWLYRIATNVCFDMLEGRQRLGQPSDLPDRLVAPHADPADVTATRDTVRLAFVAALRHLPPKQRAALILCEVLRWKASEVAELLETSVASVSSALQRARTALQARDPSADTSIPVGKAESRLLARYVQAFERYDMDGLTDLIRADVCRSRQPARASRRGTGRGKPSRQGATWSSSDERVSHR
jgi:RNA polymerase sigma-70 factor, ECF subfamily